MRIIKPTIEVAVNMVEAAIENKVKKLILTSSIVAVGGGKTPDSPHDESHWNNGTKIPYYIAKMESERQAWDLVDKSDMKMNTIHPGAIIGPGFDRSTPSTDIFIDTMNNNYPAIPPIRLSLVDVRDVAAAHLLVYETEGSEGRFIAAGSNMKFEEIIDKIISIRPEIKKPGIKMPAFMLKQYAFFTTIARKMVGKSSDYTYRQAKEQTADKGFYTDSKLEALGWQKTEINKSFKDTIEWLEKNS